MCSVSSITYSENQILYQNNMAIKTTYFDTQKYTLKGIFFFFSQFYAFIFFWTLQCKESLIFIFVHENIKKKTLILGFLCFFTGPPAQKVHFWQKYKFDRLSESPLYILLGSTL